MDERCSGNVPVEVVDNQQSLRAHAGEMQEGGGVEKRLELDPSHFKLVPMNDASSPLTIHPNIGSDKRVGKTTLRVCGTSITKTKVSSS